MSSISHSITNQQANASFGVAKQRVYKLPDDRCLFYTQCFNGCDVITIGSRSFTGPDGSKMHRVWIFDREFVIRYRAYLEMIYSVFNMGRSDCTFHVDTLMYGDKSWLGALKIHASGVVTFDNERIGTKQARILLSKAVMMYG